MGGGGRGHRFSGDEKVQRSEVFFGLFVQNMFCFGMFWNTLSPSLFFSAMNKKQQLKELNAQGAAEIALVDADIVEQKGNLESLQ